MRFVSGYRVLFVGIPFVDGLHHRKLALGAPACAECFFSLKHWSATRFNSRISSARAANAMAWRTDEQGDRQITNSTETSDGD